MVASLDDVEGIDLLRWEDQEKIQKYVDGGSVNTTAAASVTGDKDCAVEVSQTSRATCKHCSEKIIKGTVSVLLIALFYCHISFSILYDENYVSACSELFTSRCCISNLAVYGFSDESDSILCAWFSSIVTTVNGCAINLTYENKYLPLHVDTYSLVNQHVHSVPYPGSHLAR